MSRSAGPARDGCSFALLARAALAAGALAAGFSIAQETEHANGIYGGVVETGAGFALAILHEGRIIGQTSERETLATSVFTGAYEIDGARLTGTVHGIDISGPRATRTFFENRPISGTLRRGQSLRLPAEGAPLSLPYGNVNVRDSSLSLWEGTWAVIDEGVSTRSLTVGPGGAFFGQDANGCTTTGMLSELDAQRNLYGLQTMVELCGENDGSYTGFAYLDPLGGARNEFGLMLATTQDGGNFWGDTWFRPGGAPPVSLPAPDDSGDGRDTATVACLPPQALPQRGASGGAARRENAGNGMFGRDRQAAARSTGIVALSGAFSAQRVIATDAGSARSVHAADLDGDGDTDVLSASWYDGKIAWHENLGTPTATAAAAAGRGEPVEE